MENKFNILIAEDNDEDLLLVKRALKQGGIEARLVRVDNAESFSAELKTDGWDVIISDFAMPSFTGLDAIRLLKESGLRIPFIIVSGTIGEATAVEVMKAGANDYVMKDNLSRLPLAVRREHHDLKRRKEIERQEEALRYSQKMESIGRLAGGVAHDFNNQLGVVTLLCSMIQEELGPNHSAHKYVEQILGVCGKSADLVKRLLAFSTKNVADFKTVDFNALLRENQMLLKKLLGEDIHVTLKACDEAWVRINPGLFENAIMNLAINARDAMTKGGALEFKTSLQDNKVVPEVRDTGVGMTADVRAKIFEPFFTTKQVGKGAGLGLAMVYAIVKQSDGDIEVESAPNKGTTLTIRLPLAQESTTQAEPEPVPVEPPAHSRTLLVVEDEDALREVLVEVLELSGYKVLIARDGLEALDIFGTHSHEVDLVLTDMNMPNKGGRELRDDLLAVKADVKVIFMSGYSEQTMGLEALVETENVAYLSKPASRAQLLSKITEVLSE